MVVPRLTKFIDQLTDCGAGLTAASLQNPMCPTPTDSDSEQGSLEDFLEQCLAPCCWEIWKTCRTGVREDFGSGEEGRVTSVAVSMYSQQSGESTLSPCLPHIGRRPAANLESISNVLIHVDEQEDQLKKQIMDPLVLTRAVRSCFHSKRANCTLTARSLAPRGVWLQSQRDVNLERQYAPGFSPRHADQHEFRRKSTRVGPADHKDVLEVEFQAEEETVDVTINNLTINFCLQESIGKQLAAFHCSFSKCFR
ncbi:hect E3 ubiquitin ligase [Culex quinquefasciatus]|uniref:Hect E3 ubiquitin ligase n=1 Tax=Culex quinquefasciatus TaxID=7176 RepID=B0WRG6_CULQU|nr:hect E3 ubiquitin ligase [Culex quinquefasciatus]|eukprot:XP_001851300.1 hect E3 ubiquitin ligase [Culex quinquefasciatus]